MRTSSRSELYGAADALRGLALLLSSGSGLRQALLQWPRVVAGPTGPLVAEASALVALGAPLADVTARLYDRGKTGVALAGPLRDACRVDRHGEWAVASMLDAAADELSARASGSGAADAATSGARLSARMVAALPVVFLWLIPAALKGGIEAVDVAMFGAGGALIYAGTRWLARCHPRPAPAPAVPSALREIAALLRAGLSMGEALEIVSRTTRWEALRTSALHHRLGFSWVQALRREGSPQSDRLASICERARWSVGPAARALDRLAAELFEAEQQTFDERVRRAPVVMVLPLVLCILPGFAIVTLGPFIRRLLA